MTTYPRTLCFALAVAATLAASGCDKAPQATPAPLAVPVTAADPAATATTQVSDVDVTEHVKTALLRSEVLKGFDIAVVTLKGDVRLIGTVGKQGQVDEANRIARAAEGVHAVHDELTLAK